MKSYCAKSSDRLFIVLTTWKSQNLCHFCLSWNSISKEERIMYRIRTKGRERTIKVQTERNAERREGEKLMFFSNWTWIWQLMCLDKFPRFLYACGRPASYCPHPLLIITPNNRGALSFYYPRFHITPQTIVHQLLPNGKGLLLCWCNRSLPCFTAVSLVSTYHEISGSAMVKRFLEISKLIAGHDGAKPQGVMK